MAAKLFLVTSESMGQGDEQLGRLLMANFLRLLGESREKPTTIVFMNSGVRLVCDGSNALEHAKKLEAQGVEMLACTTCLEYFDLTDKLKVGKPTTMAKTIQQIMTQEVVSV
jgi:selenium metabolism protein YedF